MSDWRFCPWTRHIHTRVMHFSFTEFFIVSVLIVYTVALKECNFVPLYWVLYMVRMTINSSFDLDSGFYSNSPSLKLTLCVKKGGRGVCNYGMNMWGKESTLKTLNLICTHFSAVSEIHLDQKTTSFEILNAFKQLTHLQTTVFPVTKENKDTK